MNNDDSSQAAPVFSTSDTPASDAGLYSGPGDQLASAQQAQAPLAQPADDLAAQVYGGGSGPISDTPVTPISDPAPAPQGITPAYSPIADNSIPAQDLSSADSASLYAFGAPTSDVPPAGDFTATAPAQPGDNTQAGTQDRIDPSIDYATPDQQLGELQNPTPQQNNPNTMILSPQGQAVAQDSSGDLNGLASAISSGNNILITVNNNPSIDDLSAALGLTLALDKSDKKVTAVYSGKTPHAIAFLDPESSFQDNVTSLRDFIISLDKAKADKLKYKVDNDSGTVKIFITPYKTTITSDDLDFSAGDYNVDTVVALGVEKREDFDNCILSHGRILHDSQIITINSNEEVSSLGGFNYDDKAASSVSEIVANLIDAIGVGMIDSQVATALMTGIVAATDRFSNVKTTPKVMQVASRLMSAGANQQLISSSISGANVVNADIKSSDSTKSSDAEMVVEHGKKDASRRRSSNRNKKDQNTKKDTFGIGLSESAASPINDTKLKAEDAAPIIAAKSPESAINTARDEVRAVEESLDYNKKQAIGLDGVVEVNDEVAQTVTAGGIEPIGAVDSDSVDSSVQEKQNEASVAAKLNSDVQSTTDTQTTEVNPAVKPDQNLDLPPMPPMPPSFDGPAALPPIGDFQPDFMDSLDSKSPLTEAADSLAKDRQSQAEQQKSMDAKFNALYGDDPNKIDQT